MNSYKYDAFISYRHTEPDKSVAERLHRLLETFKIPKTIVKAIGKKRIQRVFRDRDELPTSSNLADNISAALESSEYLIVICSPRTPQSQWVLKEIETFKELHGHDKILALLIEGEPEEAFPEQLRFVKEVKTLEDGSVIETTVEVEPLAADIRAATEKEMFKKLKTEVLRLLAPMLNCTYDDLKQRHKERLVKTVLTASISLSAFFLAFGSFSTYQALIINQKSQEVNQKAEEINQKNIEIKAQIEQTQIGQSLYLADISNRYYENGDRYRAILAAQAALPKNLAEPDRPYVEEAEYALSQALGVYEVDGYFDGDIVLDHNTTINYLMASPDGKTLLTISNDGFIYIWNTDDGSLLGSIFTNNNADEHNTYFIDNNSFVTSYYDKDNGLQYSCIDNSGSIVWQSELKGDLVAYNPNKKLLAIYDSYPRDYEEKDMVFLVDAVTGNTLFCTSIEGLIEDVSIDSSDSVYLNCIAMNCDSTLISFGTNIGKIFTIDSINGKHINTINTENKIVDNIVFSDDGYLIAVSYFLNSTAETEGNNDCLEIFPPESTTPSYKWTFQIGGVEKINFLHTDPSKIVFIEWEKINIIDIKTGTINSTFISRDHITDYHLWEEAIIISSNDGTIKFFLIKEEDMIELPKYQIARNARVKNVVLANYKLIFSLFLSNDVYLFKEILNEKNIPLDDHAQDGYTQLMFDFFYSPDDSLAVSFSPTGRVCVWDVQKHELITSKWFDNNIYDVCFINNESLLVNFNNSYPEANKYATLRTSDLSVISEIQSNNLYSKFCINKESTIVAVNSFNGFYLYSLPDLNFISIIEPHEYYSGYVKAFSFTNENKLFSIHRSIARITDISTNEVLHNYESDTLDNGVLSDDGKLCALSFSDKSIKLFDIGITFEERLSINNLPLNIKAMFLSPDKKLLLVQFDNNSIHIYDTENGSHKKIVDENSFFSEINVKFSNNKDKIALISSSTSFIIDSNNFKTLAAAKIKDINNDFSFFLSAGGTSGEILYIVPYYTTELLLDEAKRQLNGRVLTEEEKAEMFIN
ncbi:MAG: TIR domain-containing protein [Clostridiaceae bacterium]|nr:TIR domain-containing protein [Clostridiaceae bacterium]